MEKIRFFKEKTYFLTNPQPLLLILLNLIIYLPMKEQPQRRKEFINMKLVFRKDYLLNGINIVAKAIPSKTTMSILECILIDASTGEIKLTGNDMELGIETKVEGDILEKGKIALDAKLFYEIIRRLPESESKVTITSDERFSTVI